MARKIKLLASLPVKEKSIWDISKNGKGLIGTRVEWWLSRYAIEQDIN